MVIQHKNSKFYRTQQHGATISNTLDVLHEPWAPFLKQLRSQHHSTGTVTYKLPNRNEKSVEFFRGIFIEVSVSIGWICKKDLSIFSSQIDLDEVFGHLKLSIGQFSSGIVC